MHIETRRLAVIIVSSRVLIPRKTHVPGFFHLTTTYCITLSCAHENARTRETAVSPENSSFGFYVQLQYLGEQLNQQDATSIEEKVKKQANASATRDIRNITMGASALGSMPGVYESYMAQNGTSYTQNIFANTVQRAGAGLGNSFIFTDPRVLNSVLDSPIGAFFNSINPGLAAANSTYAVRTGEGNEGYLWQAQALDILKNVLGVFDQGLISSAIHVDTHTGEREFKYTNQDKNRIAYAPLGPVGSYLAGQEEWSEDGMHKEGYLDGRENDANLIRSVVHTIPMFGAVYGDVTSEYIIRQTQGTQYSNYEQLNNPTLGSIAGKVAVAALIAYSVKSGAAKGETPGASLKVLLDGKMSLAERILSVTGSMSKDIVENSLLKKIADQLNLFDMKQRVIGALQALGALGRREDEGLEPELGRVARLGDPRDPALFQHVNAKLLGLVGKSFFDADGLEYEYRLEDGIVVTRYTGRGRGTNAGGSASVAQQSVNAEIAQAAPDGSILRFLQDQGIVGLFPNRPYSMADYNNTLQGHKAGFDGSHGFSIYQGAKQGAINLGRLLTWKPPHIPDNPVHDFLVESLDRAQDILNLQNRTRLFEDIRANPRFADPYYARAYLDGWEGNLEGGTIIAEQGMAAVPPGILARPLGAFGKFRGFVRGLIETPQAAVVKDFARYGGEAQRAALLERIQQTSGLSEKAGLVVQNRLQLMASEQNAIFAADPKAAIRLLSKSELNNAVRYPEAVYGRAMERAMAERIARNPALDRLLTYKGAGPGPDFTGAGRLVGQEFEVTTNKAWAAHFARSYGPDLKFILYDYPW